MPDDTRNLVMDDIVELVALRASPVRAPKPPARRWPWLRLLLLVVVPTVLTCVYAVFLAAPRYVSEARFSISKPSSGLRMPSQSISIEDGAKGLGTDDSFAVRDFLQSRDAMRLLVEKAGLRQLVKPAAADPLWTFPGPFGSGSDEKLYRYLQRLVSVDYDSSTGITILRVEAFAPADAQSIANVLLDGSETLVNRLNERARGDAIRVAEAELARARAEAMAAQDELTAFRNRWSVIDPNALSQTVIAAITALTLQVVDASAQLDVLVRSQPRSPQIAPLKGRLNALQAQIDQERRRLAGSAGSFAPRVAEYETLLLKRDFASRSFVSALAVLETARLDAERQQAFVTRIVTPQLADENAAPRPVLWTVCVLAGGLVLFWLFRRRGQS